MDNEEKVTLARDIRPTLARLGACYASMAWLESVHDEPAEKACTGACYPI